MYAITEAIKRLIEPTVQQTAYKKSSERDEKLRHMLEQLDQPIIQIAADVSTLHDKFTSMFWTGCHVSELIMSQEKKESKSSCRCLKSTIVAAMTISPRICYL
jgi:hypothetical protein